ncbi:MAG: response regulator [Pseudomonadota bacterium]
MVTGRRYSVLLVEDQALVREMITSVLEANDFRVTPVACMNEAIDAFSAASLEIDTVLSDVRLGDGRNGIELADWVRERHADMPVILMSALTDASYATYHFLQKPFTERELLTVIADATAQASKPNPTVTL